MMCRGMILHPENIKFVFLLELFQPFIFDIIIKNLICRRNFIKSALKGIQLFVLKLAEAKHS